MEMPEARKNFGIYYCRTNPEKDKFWGICESAFTYKMSYGDEPTPIELIVDPEGEYLGWLDSEGRHDARVYMVQHEKVFNIQFPYGYKLAEEKGEGIAVPLRVVLVEG